MSIEAMKQALECLNWMADSDSPAPTVSFAKAAKDLRTAIEQAEKQEPVATVRTWHKNGDQHAELADWEAGLFKLPDGEHTLYTTPPAAVVSQQLTTEPAAPYRAVKTVHEGKPVYVSEPAAPVQEPNYWNVIDPAGNIVATETDSIRGWARIAGSYKPTVEGLLGFHDQGWRVLPKVAPPAAPVQVSPLEFVTRVFDREELVGKPLFWAEWPNKEKP